MPFKDKVTDREMDRKYISCNEKRYGNIILDKYTSKQGLLSYIHIFIIYIFYPPLSLSLHIMVADINTTLSATDRTTTLKLTN